MIVSWIEFLFLSFAASLNSLSHFHLKRKVDSEFREAANRMLAESRQAMSDWHHERL